MSQHTSNPSRFPAWPPPAAVRPALAAARRRYHAAHLTARPALDDPTSYCGLFTLHDMIALAKSRYWPLPPEALSWIRERDRDRSVAELRSRARRVAELRDLLAPHTAEQGAGALRNGRSTPS
jgi:hypothetical protein